jgi:hypothetical protein
MHQVLKVPYQVQNGPNSEHIILISYYIVSKDRSPRSSARRALHTEERSEVAEELT